MSTDPGELLRITGVGPALAQKLTDIGVGNTDDLLQYYPRKYEDYSDIQPIAHIKPGTVTIKAIIKQAKGRYVRRGMHVTEAVASDDSGSVRLVWFNQPYRASSFKAGEDYFISGTFELSHQRMSIMNPSTELVSSFPVNTARIVPIYRESKGLKSAQIRKLIRALLPALRQQAETLPTWLSKEHQLIAYAKAVETMHFPQLQADLVAAQRR
jgi:ATP-dependent DNA helicase RecG